MNTKKILSLIVAIAMIAAVVPSLGLVASAADASEFTDSQVLALAKTSEAVFDAARDMKKYSGDGPISEAWDGWNGEASADTALNVNGSASEPRIQFYTTGTGNNNNGNTTNIGTVTMPGYGSGSDYIVFSFKPEYTAGWGDVALVDSNDTYITGVRFGTDNNAFNVEWGHNGWANPFASNFTDRFEMTKNGNSQTLSSGNNQIDIVLRAISDSQYTAAYFLDGAAEPFTTVTYNGSFSDIKTIKMSRGNGGQWQRISILTPVIYAGNYPAGVANVTVKFVDADGKEIDNTVTTSAAVGSPYEYTGAPAIIDAGDRRTYYAISADANTRLDSVSEDENNNIITIKYNKIEFAAVESMPEVGENYMDQFTGDVVKITGKENLVPNPGFETTDGEFSVLTWYSASTGSYFAGGIVPKDAHAWKVSKDRYYYINEAVSDTNGTPHSYGVRGNWAFGGRYNDGPTNGLCSMYANFAAKPGTTYYVSFWTKATTDNDGLLDIYTVKDINVGAQARNTVTEIFIANDDDNQDHYKVNATDWTQVTRVITTGESDNAIQIHAYYLGNGNNAGAQPYFMFDDFVIVEGEKDTSIQPDGVAAIDKITVIKGNAPILPSEVTLTNSAVANWSTTGTVSAWSEANGNDKDALGVGTYTFTGAVADTGLTATVQVEVLEETFSMPDQESYNGQPGNVVYLPVSLEKTFSMEFDLTVNAIRDSSIQIGADGAIFGAGQIGLGTNGSFSPTGGDGKGNNSNLPSITTVAAGETYRIFMTVDVQNKEYSLTLTKADGSVYTTGGTRHFRTDSDYINTITMLTNGSGANGDLEITNVKFNAPEAASAIQNYTVKFSGVEYAEYSVPTTVSTDVGYNDEKIFPNLIAPYIEGYVFKSKTVDTKNYTITLTYESTKATEFFTNVANDTPLISLNMLGAHNAFTAGIDGSRKDAAGTAQGDSGSRGATVAPGTAAPRSRAQSGDALQLLDAGVRYFDIRLSRSNSNARYLTATAYHTNSVIYTTHALLGGELSPILQTIAQWAKAHPGEIIVLDFQEFYDNVNSDGNSTADSWRVLDSLLADTGVKEFVTLNKGSDVSIQTYGGLTNNGTKSNIVLFGRATATNSNIGNFIYRGTITATDFDGQLYSNYSNGVSIGSSFSTTYINGQITQMGTKSSGNHAIASMFRVMQAQSESSNLVNTASSDNSSLYSALQSNPNWLTSLPVVMVNDAVTNTSGILDILKKCNEPIDVDVTYTGDASFSTKKKMMVGTIYTGNHEMVSNGGKNYYVTTETPNTAGSTVIPVPYNSSISLAVAAIDSNVFTISKNEQANRYIDNGDSNTKNNGGYTVAYFDGGAPDPYFSAYTWGAGNSDNRRIGVAILDVNSGNNIYTLDATRLRDQTYSGENNISFYAISYNDFKALDLSDFDAITAMLTDENKVASIVSHESNDNPNDTVSIALDAAKMSRIIGAGEQAMGVALDDDSTKVVVLGDSSNGLYRLGDLAINSETVFPVITPALGWDGSGFTIDFIFGDKFVKANGEAYDDKPDTTGLYFGVNLYAPQENLTTASDAAASSVAAYANGAGVGFSTSYTNVPFKYAPIAMIGGQTAVGNIAGSTVSVYELFVNALEKGKFGEKSGDQVTVIASEQLPAATKVLNDGGIYIVNSGGSYDLDETTKKLMELSGGDGSYTVTLKDTMYAAGLRFENGVASVDDAGAEGNVTVNGNGKSVTITGVAGLDEFVTVFLESVDIVFVPETVVETEVQDNVSNASDFQDIL